MESIGLHLLALGVIIICVTAAFRPDREESVVSGFDKETAELLTRPAHEVLARQLAVAHGAPEFMWRKYTPLVVNQIIQRPPNAS
jgi:hypothetical protein